MTARYDLIAPAMRENPTATSQEKDEELRKSVYNSAMLDVMLVFSGFRWTPTDPAALVQAKGHGDPSRPAAHGFAGPGTPMRRYPSHP